MASAFAVLPPNKVVRADGTIVKLETSSSVREEIRGIWTRLKDWRMLGTERFISFAQILV